MESLTLCLTPVGTNLTAFTAHLSTIIHHQDFLFVFLFVFRYLRLLVHLFSFHFLYKSATLPSSPSHHRSDCTVIIPTLDPHDAAFTECLSTVLANEPDAIFIVTVGPSLLAQICNIVEPFRLLYPKISISITTTSIANKRRQVASALPHVQTKFTVLVDDHVFWPSTNFLLTTLAPFEDPKVGVVGTNKRVRRHPTGFNWPSFWNFIACLYLERHNFEIRATNALDGGVFVISGRTSVHRTSILNDPEFIEAFTNERFFFNLFGPLIADDDNFITRWTVRRGWKIKVQYSDEARIETTLGTYPKFLSQVLRWTRTTWRSNAASLFSPTEKYTVWWRQPWCVYAVYLTSFVNFAFFYDLAMMWAVTKTTWFEKYRLGVVKALIAWIFVTKLVKPFPHFTRHPSDFQFLLGYLAFGYLHSFIKLYAGLTFWVTSWGGRDLEKAESQSQSEDKIRAVTPVDAFLREETTS